MLYFHKLKLFKYLTIHKLNFFFFRSIQYFLIHVNFTFSVILENSKLVQ